MSKYQKPICDCGAELFFEVDEVQSVQYRILRNGNIAKRPFYRGVGGINNWGRLVCNSCSKQYDFNRFFVGEHKFKILRDEEL